MHFKSAPEPAKNKDTGRDMPCCKTLRAITTVKISVMPDVIDCGLQPYFIIATLPEISRPPRSVFPLDIGPPGALSFSESVLQRSILAHAPPFLPR
jgi:hypothetical protein